MYYLGLDIGSVTTKMAVIDENLLPIYTSYLRTNGRPADAVRQAFVQLDNYFEGDIPITAVGTTGSGRHLAAAMSGADEIRTEITAHAVAAAKYCPQVSTVIDIGGQDSKVIYIKNGVTVGFNMNTVCAAGTGSCLDKKAERLKVPVEEFGSLAMQSSNPAHIAGRCGVFAESDLIHKQQMGASLPDLAAGLCLSLARNYLQNVAHDINGKKLRDVILFQGGVAANIGMKSAFEKLLKRDLVIPEHFKVMGAWGVAILAHRKSKTSNFKTKFRGLANLIDVNVSQSSFICKSCANQCEINQISIGKDVVGRWGNRCPRWDDLTLQANEPDDIQQIIMECGRCQG
jgi:predicted CoA-substrate-specific enzyme activase